MEGQMAREEDMQIDKQSDGWAGEQTDRKTDGQDRENDRLIDG